MYFKLLRLTSIASCQLLKAFIENCGQQIRQILLVRIRKRIYTFFSSRRFLDYSLRDESRVKHYGIEAIKRDYRLFIR